MTKITRRTALAIGASAACVAALPTAAAEVAGAPPPVAEMFSTSDEPWGALVRGHVSTADYQSAVLRMLDKDSDAAVDGEGWLFENRHDEDGNRVNREIVAEPEHTYMRVGDPNPDFDETWYVCKADDPGAVPITAVMY